jgi:hypothetical protein
MKSPCTVTMNGEYPCSDETWDDLAEAIQWCDYNVKTGRATYYKIECKWGTMTHTSEDETVNIFADNPASNAP